MDYRWDNHSKNRLRYHFVFSTKYRKKCLLGIEKEVYKVFREVTLRSDFTIVEMGIDNGDHIHLIIKSKPSLSPEQIVRRLKQMTSHDLWEQYSDHFKKFYWKRNRKLLWASGYFVSTIGAVSDKVVLEYVRKQGK